MTKQYQLPKEFAERWVAALRSGKYEQGIGALTLNKAYCCLGVACKVAGINDSDIKNYSTIPFGLNGIPNVLFGNNEDLITGHLIYLNDSIGRSFPEIADWIEENVEFTESEAQNV